MIALVVCAEHANLHVSSGVWTDANHTGPALRVDGCGELRLQGGLGSKRPYWILLDVNTCG